MMTAQKFAYALGKVESNNTPYGKFGDGGRAMGQWQLHPDARDTDARLLNIVANLGETWDSYVYRIVIAFYNHYTALGYSPPEVAMTWHLGHAIHEGGAGWDTAYNTDFLIAAGWIAAPKFSLRGMKTMSPRTLAILKTLAAFLVGYGGTEVASGFRYSLVFDWQGIVGGLIASGLVNTQSEGLSSALKTMLGPAQG